MGAQDGFTQAMGRGRGVPASMLLLLSGSGAAADEELRRLSSLAERGRLGQPLDVLRTAPKGLGTEAAGRLSALRAKVIGHMLRQTCGFLDPTLEALGYGPREQTVESRAIQRNVIRLLSEDAEIPQGAWEPWIDEAWKEHLPRALAQRLHANPKRAMLHIIIDTDLATPLDMRTWERVVEVALWSPRPLTTTKPLGQDEIKECREALRQEMSRLSL